MKINSLDHKGRGICKIDGKITFVKNALPDEIVEIKVTKSKKKYNEAIVTNYIKTSDKRVNVSCPYYKNCGGCQLLHLSYKEQLIFKQDKIINICNKYLNCNIKINNIIYDNNTYYRNKISLQVNKKIGLYKQESNDIININHCLLCMKNINSSIKLLHNINTNKIRKIILRTNDDSNLLIIEGNKNIDISPIIKNFKNIVVKDDKYYLKKGKDYITQSLDKYNFRISRDSFFQINPFVTNKLYSYIKDICIKCNSSNVLDLYCGTGSISIYISGAVKFVTGIEINENAVFDALQNKKINNITNAKFICSDTKDIKITNYYDTIIVDPARAGLNNNIINEILKSNSKYLIYVSCDPMTMVRDLNKLITKYNIESITPFDMFPNTYHVECVCVLKLK